MRTNVPKLLLATAAMATVSVPSIGSAQAGASRRDAPVPAPAAEAVRERGFVDAISAERIGSYIESLTQHPTFPGSKASQEVASRTADYFREWGWQVRTDEYQVPFPRATTRVVELLTPRKYTASLAERPIPGDPYAQQTDDYLPPFFIYGPDGDVTAPAIYVNFGLRDDYATLERTGQSAKGKIVVIRAGGMWRGGKVQLAAEHGAIGVLIYSDPSEDGYFRGDTYPKGGWRSEDGVQRGSILYGKYPGDPLTPFEAAVPGAKRLRKDDPQTTIAAIPAMPLSYADMRPILDAMTGPVAPLDWRGGLPITYRSGPTKAPVHLKVANDWQTITIRNVVATLPGTAYKAEEVVRGNHRDGWTYGAQDPHSGHSAMLEEARSLGLLYRGGWRPKRTIVYASWDAEEQGVIGSTEFVEQYLANLTRNAVAYVNTDVTGPGPLSAAGAGSLAGFVNDLARVIEDPGAEVSVAQRAALPQDMSLYRQPSTSPLGTLNIASAAKVANAQVVLGPPGYGSDHHAFVSHAGIATLNLSFGGPQLNMGAYHTGYDDLAWYRRFGDPGFKFGAATAKMNGLAVMRLADADVLPMNFVGTAASIRTEIAGLTTIVNTARKEVERQNAMVEADAYKILLDPTQPRFAPPIRTVPSLDLAPLTAAASRVDAAAAAFAAARAAIGTRTLSHSTVVAVNAAMMKVERAFLRKNGLPERPHYRNELFSPGRLWDTVPLPAIGDAVLDNKWDDAARQVAPTAGTLDGIAVAIEATTAALRADR